MNYEIRIKGKNDTLVVSGAQGQNLKRDWENYHKTKRNMVVEIGTWTGPISDIRDFTRVAANRSESGTTDRDMATWNHERAVVRALTPEKKAMRLGLFKFVYFVWTGVEPSADILAKAQAIQLQFFTDNPKRTVCNPVLFRPLISLNKYSTVVVAKDGMKRLSPVGSGIRMVENCVVADIKASRYA